MSTSRMLSSLIRGIALTALLFPLSALATPMVYTVETGTQNGFGFSVIHAATNTAGMAPYYPSGATLLDLSGTLTGDFDGTTLTLAPSTLTAVGVGGGFAGTWTIDLTGGAITAAGPVAGGTIDYVLRRPDASVFDAGTFHFAPVNFPGAPNSLTDTQLALWGNNWNNSVAVRRSVQIPLGFDLRAQGVTAPVPEPSAVLLFGAGLFVAARRPRLAARAGALA